MATEKEVRCNGWKNCPGIECSHYLPHIYDKENLCGDVECMSKIVRCTEIKEPDWDE